MRRSEPGSPHPATTEAPAAELASGPAPTPAPVAAARPPVAEPSAVAAPTSPSGHPTEKRARGPRPVPVTVWRRVPGEPAAAYAIVVPVDLARVFRGFGPLPAVSGTEGLDPADGPWGRAGQRRTVLLADGSTLDEVVIEASSPGLFRYEVVPTSGALRLVVRRIDGRFVFSHSECGGSVIRWTYVFRPRHFAGPLVRLLAPLWRRYATHVMERLASEVAALTEPPDAPARTA